MARLAIFIDGGYLTALAKEAKIWIAYDKFSQEVLNSVASKTPEPVDLLRTYYYDCLPYQSNPPTPAESTRFAKARSFHEALEKLPRYTVRKGLLKFRGYDGSGQPIFQQKRVDLLLGLDFALLSAKSQISHAAIVTGDSDLVPAFEIARTEGQLVWLFHGPAKSRVHGNASYASELWHTADERVEIDQNFLKRVERTRS